MVKVAGVSVGVVLLVLLTILTGFSLNENGAKGAQDLQDTKKVAASISEGSDATSNLSAEGDNVGVQQPELPHLNFGQVDSSTEEKLDVYVPFTSDNVGRESVASVVMPILEENELLSPGDIEVLVDHAYYTAHWLLDKDYESLQASMKIRFPHEPEQWERVDEDYSSGFHSAYFENDIRAVGFWKTPVKVTLGKFNEHLHEPSLYYGKDPKSEEFIRGQFAKSGQDSDETVFARIDVLVKFPRGATNGMYGLYSQLYYYNDALATFTDLDHTLTFLRDPVLDVASYALRVGKDREDF